jgi:uncharacterized membrane protein
MIFDVILSQLTTLDLFVVGFGLLAAFLIGHVIENPPKSRASVTALMSYYRRAWMLNFVDRDPRIFDSQTLASLRQSTAFFRIHSFESPLAGYWQSWARQIACLNLPMPFTQSQEATALKLQFKLAVCRSVFGACLFEICMVQPPVWLLRRLDGSRAE